MIYMSMGQWTKALSPRLAQFHHPVTPQVEREKKPGLVFWTGFVDQGIVSWDVDKPALDS